MPFESAKAKTFTCECGAKYDKSKSRIDCRKTHKVVRASSVSANEITPKKRTNSLSLKRASITSIDDSAKSSKDDFVTWDEFRKEVDLLRRQFSLVEGTNNENDGIRPGKPIEVHKYYCPRCEQAFQTAQECESHDLTCFIDNGLILKKTREVIVSALIRDYSKELTKSLLGELVHSASEENDKGKDEKQGQRSQVQITQENESGSMRTLASSSLATRSGVNKQVPKSSGLELAKYKTSGNSTKDKETLDLQNMDQSVLQNVFKGLSTLLPNNAEIHKMSRFFEK